MTSAKGALFGLRMRPSEACSWNEHKLWNENASPFRSRKANLSGVNRYWALDTLRRYDQSAGKCVDHRTSEHAGRAKVSLVSMVLCVSDVNISDLTDIHLSRNAQVIVMEVGQHVGKADYVTRAPGTPVTTFFIELISGQKVGSSRRCAYCKRHAGQPKSYVHGIIRHATNMSPPYS